MTNTKFKDSVVLVTGAAGGIGKLLVTKFQDCGARVYATDLQSTSLPHFSQGDISDPAFITKWIDDIIKSEGRIDVLVNNAGICPRTNILDISLAEWQKVIDVNLTSIFFLSQQVMKVMTKQQSGAMVNLASLAGKVGGIAVGAHYSASKAAIGCLTKTLARYGAPYGVRVNAVAPGVINTAITHVANSSDIDNLKQAIPLGRIGEVDEVVQPILFLASEKASYITGATLDINGGLLMD
jgi:NAD(P)-dependent dehydrogenase (short-subunit alcohol dehydrogenase family)